MYIRGDVIRGIGEVEFNHCGLPWPVGMDGQYCGVVQVRKPNLDSVWCDAISGKVLTDKEMEGRKNNFVFDYEGKYQNCQEWRKTFKERIILGDVKWHCRDKCNKNAWIFLWYFWIKFRDKWLRRR